MAATQFLSKATLLALSVITILSLHGAEAQTTNSTNNNNYVPGWGIAILVLVSIILLLALLSICVFPLIFRKASSCSHSK